MSLGFLLYIIIGLRKTKRKHPEGFSYKKYFKDEALTIMLSAVSAIILVLVLPELSGLILPAYAGFTKLICVAIGVFNYTLIRGVVDIIFPKKFIKQDV